MGKLTTLVESIDRDNAQKIKLILHVGTPKTGTTSIQTYLNKKQRKLREKGILYPHNIEKLKNPTAPKHQWFEKNMVASHFEHLLENFKNILSQVKHNTHTIILSSEGIYNYWWDFSEESKGVLVELGLLFEVEVWVWFRDPLEFIERYYKQCIRNPRVRDNPCYGQELSFAEMFEIRWFSQHLNYCGFVEDCQKIFGENSVAVYEYEGDVVQKVIQKLGLATVHDNPTPRLNESLSNPSIEILRTINRINMSAKDKQLLMPHIKNIDDIVGHYQTDSLIDDETKLKVLALHQPIALKPMPLLT